MNWLVSTSLHLRVIVIALAILLMIVGLRAVRTIPRAANRERLEPPLTRFFKRHYRSLLPAFVGKPKLAIVSMLLLFGLTAATIPFLGKEFLPNFKETDFLMHWVEKPGTSLEAMNRITVRASKELCAIPGVRNFVSHIGRAEVADEIEHPLAVVILGGLVTSTLLNLFLMPALYLRYGAKRPEEMPSAVLQAEP